MRLTRVYLEGALTPGTRQAVEGSAANHIVRVLRLRVGDALTLFDGTGGEYAASVAQIHKDRVWVNVLEHSELERESPLELTLAQGISRGERMDWVVQKATELGVTAIIPIFTERSVVRLDLKQSQKKTQHWRAIAVAACEQSGRNRVPEVRNPLTLYEFLEALSQPVGALSSGAASNPAGTISTRLLLSPGASLRIADVRSADAGATVLIGPEGGLAGNEQEAALTAGFTAVRLGPRVLRTETAAMAALSLLQHRFGDL